MLCRTPMLRRTLLLPTLNSGGTPAPLSHPKVARRSFPVRVVKVSIPILGAESNLLRLFYLLSFDSTLLSAVEWDSTGSRIAVFELLLR